MEWFQYPITTFAERILTSFICCGWAYGAIFCPLPLPPLKLSQIWEGFWNYGSLLGCKWQHFTVAEVLTQHGMVPTSPLNICKVVDNLHMLWMGILVHHKAICQQCVLAKNWEVFWNHSLLGLQKTPLCSGWGPNPTWNASHIPSQHMNSSWQASSAVDGHMKPSSGNFNMCIGQNLGSLLKLWFTAGLQMTPLCSGRGLRL